MTESQPSTTTEIIQSHWIGAFFSPPFVLWAAGNPLPYGILMLGDHMHPLLSGMCPSRRRFTSSLLSNYLLGRDIAKGVRSWSSQRSTNWSCLFEPGRQQHAALSQLSTSTRWSGDGDYQIISMTMKYGLWTAKNQHSSILWHGIIIL